MTQKLGSRRSDVVEYPPERRRNDYRPAFQTKIRVFVDADAGPVLACYRMWPLVCE